MIDNSTLAQEDDSSVDFFELFQVVAENLKLLILGSLFCGLVALGITFLIRPTFTATTVFLPPQAQQSATSALLQALGGLGGIAATATGIKNPNDQFVAFIKSDFVQNNLIDRFKLRERYETEFMIDTRYALTKKTRVSARKDGLIAVEVDDHEPAFAAKLANAYVEELSKLLQRLALSEAQHRRIFFEAQFLDAKDKLANAENALRASGVNSSALKSNPEVALEVVSRVRAEIAAQEVRLSSMRTYLADTAPAFKQAYSELLALRGQLSRLEKSHDSNTQPVDPSDSDYIARFRDFKYYETLFEVFAKQFELAKLDEAREGAVVQVVDFASEPERKSAPKRAIVAIVTTVVAGLLLLVFVFSRSHIRKLRSTPEGAMKVQSFQRAIWGRS
jgi:tyrosine-protein kinase Etk/Wzc